MMIAAGWAFGLREIAANNLRPTYWIGRKKGPGSSSSISLLIIITTIIVYHRRRLLNVGPGPHHKGTTTISRSNVVVVVVVLWNFLRFDHRTFSPPSDDYYQLALRHNSISATAAALSQSVYNVLTIGKLQATTCTQGRRRRNNNKRIMISLPDARNV